LIFFKDFIVGAKGGSEHHFAVRLREDKEKVLAFVRDGLEVRQAVLRVGRKPEVLKSWMKDTRFASDLEAARSVGEVALERALPGGDRHKIPFATFSKEFLNTEVFPHNQNMVDLLEGREPGWLHDSMVYEPSSSQRILVNVPPEHAKSTTLTVNYPTYRIAMDPNVRIVIVSQTQQRAKEFLYSIKQRLTEEPWAKFQQVYGPAEGYKATSDEWTKDRIYLQRESGEKDPTVQALGMGQQIYGARADLIILDDVVGTTNAHEWEKQLAYIQKMVITRLGKNGMLIIAGTRVSSVDLYRELMNPDHWSGGKSPFTRLAMPAVLEFKDKPKDWVTLWPESDRPWDGDADEPDENGRYAKWDGPALYTRRGEVSPSTWALVYQQQDVEEDAIFSPVAVHSCINRMRKAGPINPKAPGHPKDGEWITLMGMDPAMSGKSAFIIYAVERNTGERMVLDAYNMGDSTPQKIRALIEEWVMRYRPMELIIEINAHQKSYALDSELNQWLAQTGTRMRSHFTGKNKWDTSFGVAAMSTLFGSVKDGKHQDDNLITLPSHEGSEHFKALVNQLITWKADTKNATDLVMALWFCEMRARELVLAGKFRQTHLTSRWASRKNAALAGAVNLDELASEQFLGYL
jgi:hypothetical protein